MNTQQTQTKAKSKKQRHRRIKKNTAKPSTAERKLFYQFWILILDLILAGVAMVMKVETPVIWTFLTMIAGWVAFTSPRTTSAS